MLSIPCKSEQYYAACYDYLEAAKNTHIDLSKTFMANWDAGHHVTAGGHKRAVLSPLSAFLQDIAWLHAALRPPEGFGQAEAGDPRG